MSRELPKKLALANARALPILAPRRTWGRTPFWNRGRDFEDAIARRHRVDKLLVAGINTTVGANIAAWLALRYQVVGLSFGPPLSIANCETAECDPASAESVHRWVASQRPQWIVYCGPGALSSWDLPATAAPPADAVARAGFWARAALEFDAELSAVSSDAIFTGPWMFHRENGQCYCESPSAKILRLIEREVIDACDKALVVRTNAFGISPVSDQPGLVETCIQSLQDGTPLALDCMRHATPILATDLAEILDRAYQQRLRGVFHIGGGERINPFRFGCLLADQFCLPTSSLEAIETPFEHRRDYGAGECSLQTRKLRKTLDLPLPLVREGLIRLHELHASGYRDRFAPAGSSVPEKVA
jgi:dTDP-4-dehydrorhamnose reductase